MYTIYIYIIRSFSSLGNGSFRTSTWTRLVFHCASLQRQKVLRCKRQPSSLLTQRSTLVYQFSYRLSLLDVQCVSEHSNVYISGTNWGTHNRTTKNGMLIYTIPIGTHTNYTLQTHQRIVI